ncbi:MAG: hypothetical protein ACYC3L_01370 [Gemmatimonadaceae bacterium]
MTPPVVADAFVWTRRPKLDWVHRLHAMRPMTDHTTGLAIAWEPGDPWEPVQRWFIYEVFPKHAIPPQIREQLDGPNPRSTGHACFGTNALGRWCQCPNPKMRWVGGPAPGITRQAWTLYRKHGGWARPLWVIQGKDGGHKYRFTQWESRLSKMAGGPEQPPIAGDLPYAEPDERTWNNVHLYSDPQLAKMYRGLVDFGMRRPGDLDPTDKRAAEFAAKEVLKSFGLKMMEHADELTWALKRQNVNTAHIDTPDGDADAAEAAAIAELSDTFNESM